jgi:two-component system OmpR family response regulator
MAIVLVVEDDIDLCDTYVDILKSSGYEVHRATTGTEAIDALIHDRLKPDVVILDIQIPGNSGILVLSLIRGLPRLHNTKVIIASGHTDTGQWAVSQWRADLFLQKPIPTDLLKRTINDFTSAPANSEPGIT